MASKKDSCTHRCECKHASVKFCAVCAVVHCLDCKQEWASAPCVRPHSDFGWRWVGAGQSLLNVGAIGGGTSLTFPANGLEPADPTPTIYCTHGTA